MPKVDRTPTAAPVETTETTKVEETVTDSAATEEPAAVVDEKKTEIEVVEAAPEPLEEVAVPVGDIVVPEVVVVLDEVVPAPVAQLQEDNLPVVVVDAIQEEIVPVTADVTQVEQEEALPAPVTVAEEPETVILVQQEEALPGIPVAPENDAPPTVDDVVLAQIEEDLIEKTPLIPLVAEAPLESDAETPVEPVGEIIIVKQVQVPSDEPEDEPVSTLEGGIANVSLVSESEEDAPVETPLKVELQDIQPPNYNKKKHPAITKLGTSVPGLTQKPVEYIRPPGIAAEAKEHWNGYTTWWTKLGNRVAKLYNYE